MTRLCRIKDTVQSVADAISVALGIETEVVDNELNIVAGTGRYKDKIGGKEENGCINAGYLYGRVLTTGKECIIEDATTDLSYDPSVMRGETEELAEVCAPIIVDKEVVGVIALVAFTSKQQSDLLLNKEQLLIFIRHMGNLLASKISEAEMSNRIATILESIHEGVIAVNSQGQITHCNRKGEELIRCKRSDILNKHVEDILPGTSIMEVVTTGKGFVEREELFDPTNRGKIHLMVTAKPLVHGKNPTGAVVSFRDFRDVYKLVTDMVHISHNYFFEDIKGKSMVLQEIIKKAQRIAISNSTVLIMGESGTGKDLFARAIHAASRRADKPFVAINCGAIPETLLESELFGYEGGAFTGSRREGKAGKFEIADGGTILFDEIGDLSLHLQVKLLHVLQRREIERVGSNKIIPVDVRVIAATNRDLEQMILEGEFREDLFYRLNVIPLRLPPLRERKGDIALLIDHFLSKHSALVQKPISGYDKEVLDLFNSYDWPGNVRELENAVEYAVNMGTGNTISLACIPPRIKPKPINWDSMEYLKKKVVEYEKNLIKQCLQQFGDTLRGKQQAAKALGISQATLYRKLKE